MEGLTENSHFGDGRRLHSPSEEAVEGLAASRDLENVAPPLSDHVSRLEVAVPSSAIDLLGGRLDLLDLGC